MLFVPYFIQGKYNLVQHVQNVHENLHKFECNVCKIKFKKNNDLKHHNAIKHKDESFDAQFDCKICNKNYPHERALKNHQRLVHRKEPRLPCTMCDKKFKTKDKLKRHLQSTKHK